MRGQKRSCRVHSAYPPRIDTSGSTTTLTLRYRTSDLFKTPVSPRKRLTATCDTRPWRFSTHPSPVSPLPSAPPPPPTAAVRSSSPPLVLSIASPLARVSLSTLPAVKILTFLEGLPGSEAQAEDPPSTPRPNKSTLESLGRGPPGGPSRNPVHSLSLRGRIKCRRTTSKRHGWESRFRWECKERRSHVWTGWMHMNMQWISTVAA